MNTNENENGGVGAMQALVFSALNTMELRQIAPATIREPDECLVRIRAVGVCGSDLHGFTGKTGRRTIGMVMGHEAAGVVEKVGGGVKKLKPGDRVAIQPVRFCGQCAMCYVGKSSLCLNRQVLGVHAQAGGAYAEYVAWPERCLVPIPEHLSFEDAAFAEPLAVCVHALRLAGIQTFDNVALVGSGPIGLLTLAILKTMGLRKVFVSDVSDARLEVAKAIGGADLVVPINPSTRTRALSWTGTPTGRARTYRSRRSA
jgi:L-iditol 2-dehydrogenase